MITPRPYQITLFEKALTVIKEHMLVYLACEERVGKSLPAVMICEAVKVKTILIVTKKEPIQGWKDLLKQYPHTKDYTVTNYHQLHKFKPIYDLVILDEAHNYISSVPKPSKLWFNVNKLTKRKPIIYISATPYPQGYQQLYHQFALSSWSPWKKWRTFDQWFGSFGIPESVWVPARQMNVPIYTHVERDCFDLVKHLFITMTRQQVGFDQEPKDQIHWIELSKNTRTAYNYLTKKKAAKINGNDLVCDTTMKLRTTLHMIEGGGMIVSKKVKRKIKREYIVLGNTEKIDWILETFGDSKDLVIMYHYVVEGIKLKQYFNNATILSATRFAEGIDLYQYEDMVVYSQNFQTAKYIQRRARQTNLEREEDITVHYLLVKGAISEAVYNAVAMNKVNYTDSLYFDNCI